MESIYAAPVHQSQMITTEPLCNGAEVRQEKGGTTLLSHPRGIAIGIIECSLWFKKGYKLLCDHTQNPTQTAKLCDIVGLFNTWSAS